VRRLLLGSVLLVLLIERLNSRIEVRASPLLRFAIHQSVLDAAAAGHPGIDGSRQKKASTS
jgi:hypothetical protein